MLVAADFKAGFRVVRSKGDYVVGRVGTVIAVDLEKSRALIKWDAAPKSWVTFTALEDASKPFKLTEFSICKRTGRRSYPKYVAL